MTHAPDAPGPGRPATVPGLRARVALARLAMLWENIWQALWQPVCALAVFLSLSLFDAWRHVPLLAHWCALLALALFGALGVFQQRGLLRLPQRHSILARIERDNDLRHQPLRTLEDRQELGLAVADARALWRTHLARISQALPRLRFIVPRPRTIRFDRHGLRQMAGIALIAGLIVAGPQSWRRIETGFTPSGFSATAPARLEAWITPPAYTGAAPIMLAADSDATAPVSAPAGSELSIRLFGARDAELRMTPQTGNKQRLALTKIDSANSHALVKLQQSMAIELRQAGAASREWQISIIPDQPPVISLLEAVSVTRQYALRMKYGATDDYGVVSAAVEITPADGVSPPAAPLRMELALSQAAAKKGETAYADLAAHPWAGRPVRLGLIATDAAGQTGRSQPVDLILPQRPFNQPLARAIIEQRQTLAAGRAGDKRAIQGLDALSLYPDKFIPDLRVYLPLRVARHRTGHLREGDGGREQVLDLLWQIALRLEDGDSAIASNELRALQNALMQALRDGASDEEIARLTQALREALARYMQTMAEQQMEDDEQPMRGNPEQGETIDQADISKMLDQIEKLSRAGAREAAQDMLSSLQKILENLRPGVAGGGKTATQKLYGEALGDVSGMMRKQQQLQDETAQAREQGGAGQGSLGRTQEQLGKELGDLMGKLGEAGKEGAPSALGRAESAMQEAAKALREGAAGEALEPQSQAMDQLRAGAGALAKILREEAAKAQAGNGGGDGNSHQETDPLGRPMASDAGGATAIPEQFDIERALQIRRELELRSSQRRRPPEELNYIDRLLKLF